MADDGVKIVQLCSICGAEVGSFSVKKENMMLSSRDTVWCPNCKVSVPEIREAAGRQESIDKEREAYPRSLPTW
ncbi:MAG: hypothetical protein HYX93_03120 [Chloroflexi bacterium]|nr:hypothetical protein [Chloroflexota bacterium]